MYNLSQTTPKSHLSLPHDEQTTASKAGVGKITQHGEAGGMAVPPRVVVAAVVVVVAGPIVAGVPVVPAPLVPCPPPPGSGLPGSPSCQLAKENYFI